MTHHRPNARLLIVASYHGPYICACLVAFETWRRAMQRRRVVSSHEEDESDNFSRHKALPAERGKNGSRHVLLILHAHPSPPDQPGRSGHSVCGTHGPFLMPGRTRWLLAALINWSGLTSTWCTQIHEADHVLIEIESILRSTEFGHNYMVHKSCTFDHRG